MSQEVPKTVADVLRDAQKGSERPAVIVVTDIAGFMQLIAEAGDLEASQVLSRFFAMEQRLVDTHAGKVVKVLGDGAMILFSKVETALDFAIALQRALSEDPIRLATKFLRIRLGIHTGLVLLVNTSYGEDVLGVDVNVAARLTDFATPGQIVLSASAVDDLPKDRRRLLGPMEHAMIKPHRAGPGAQHDEDVGFVRIDVGA
jgi:adenylate cyclase